LPTPPPSPDTSRPLDAIRSTAPGDDDDSRELRRYRRACQEVDRLLEEGRLSEALRVNDEVRTLLRSLFARGRLG
jgi:hypothetical protein